MQTRMLWMFPFLFSAIALGEFLSGRAAAQPLASKALGSSNGVAIFVPSTLHADQDETFQLVFTIGPSGFPQGSKLKVRDADFHGMGWTMFQRFQTSNPALPGYLTVSSSNSGVTLSVDRSESVSVQGLSFTVVTLQSGSLIEGETITLTFGNATSPHRAYQNVTWLVLSDTDGDDVFEYLAVQPTLDIAPDSTPSYMFASGPTYVQQGVPFDLTVRVLDTWGNPCVAYGEDLLFSSTDLGASLPVDTIFPPGAGFHRYPVTLNTTGVHYLFITDGGSFTINSNPIIVVDELPDDQIFWGDLHGHHGHVYTYTVGISPTLDIRVDEYLEYARDISDLDFTSESHKSSAYWNVPQVQQEVADSVLEYESDDFVVFRGFEWMGKKADHEGHHNIYYLAADGPYWSPDDPDSDTLEKLYHLVEKSGYEALIIPHATSYSGYNWWKFNSNDLNARFRRQTEIYSHWDLSEELDPGSARLGWATGNRMGAIASTDNHYAFPGLPIGDVCNPEELGGPNCIDGRTAVGGLTAVYAPHHTRQDLWQGLKTRHTYATDGMRIYLEFTADDHPMGEQYRTTSAPHLEVSAAGTAEIDTVEVFRGTYAPDPTDPGPTEDYYTTVYTTTPGTLTTTFDFFDNGFSEDCFYYVRVTQVDGHRAWSSPIWVDYGSPGPDLWADCGDGAADPGENLVTCAEDTQFSQVSERQVVDGMPQLMANDVHIPLTGLYVYNPVNVDSFVACDDPGWLDFMERQVDRVKFAGGHYLAFTAHGHGLYSGPLNPTQEMMDNTDNWDFENLDALFDYAAQQGVYLVPTVSMDVPLDWWKDDHLDAMQTDEDGLVWNIATFHNPDYWLWADALIERFINHYKDQPALLAWDVRVGEGENNYAPPYTGNFLNPPRTWCDYSAQALSNFRAWLTTKYGADGILQSAWMSPTVTLATALIPYRLPEITPTEVVTYVNSAGDVRPDFYDWHLFRLEEKSAETAHFAALFSSLDPHHVIIGDPSYHPLAGGNRMQNGHQDGEMLYQSPDIDVILHHPRLGHVDHSEFTAPRLDYAMPDQYAIHHGKLTTWANEETSELIDSDGDQENIWRLDSVASLNASMGRGDGWVTGSVTDTLLPAWSDSERAEMLRLAGLFTAPGVQPPQPKIAALANPCEDGLDYYITGEAAVPLLRLADRDLFLDILYTHGLTIDLLTVDDVRLQPDRLADYEAILVLNQARLPLDVAQALDSYRDSGGGLFIGGRTGIFDDQGNPDSAALSTLLGASIVLQQNTDYETWGFDNITDPLVGSLQGDQYGDDNLYYIPVLGPADGYTEIAHLTDAPLVATVGYKGRTVFWFPRLTTNIPADLPIFQSNLWRFFDVDPRVSATGEVEATGDNYLSIFSPVSQTVHITYPPGMTGALVWDWNAMELVGSVSSGSPPELILPVGENSTAFLSAFQPSDEPQLVAINGASLAKTDFVLGSFQIALYRAAPGMQIQVAIHPGDLPVLDVSVEGGGLDHTDYDSSGQVYLIQVTPTGERLTIALKMKDFIFLPLVMKN